MAPRRTRLGSVDSTSGLSRETDPDKIGAGQRAEVRAFLAANPGAAAERVSEELILPLWTVRRRMAELGEGP